MLQVIQVLSPFVESCFYIHRYNYAPIEDIIMVNRISQATPTFLRPTLLYLHQSCIRVWCVAMCRWEEGWVAMCRWEEGWVAMCRREEGWVAMCRWEEGWVAMCRWEEGWVAMCRWEEKGDIADSLGLTCPDRPRFLSVPHQFQFKSFHKAMCLAKLEKLLKIEHKNVIALITKASTGDSIFSYCLHPKCKSAIWYPKQSLDDWLSYPLPLLQHPSVCTVEPAPVPASPKIPCHQVPEEHSHNMHSKLP